ncbi:MAG: hypothetical protein AB7I79_21075 [Rhizobiaceae bacterium]
MSSKDSENNAMEYGMRRLIGSDAYRRHLRAMPVFRIDEDTRQFDSLLAEIERAESRRTGTVGKSAAD